jgi:NAD(P)-dependent dehydrogenase (short-subunit alcohol dehydrogenase family)
VRGDVSVEADNVAMVDVALARFGRLDFAFLNAGVGGAFGPIAETSVEDWDYTFHVLVRGVFLGAKHCSQAIRRHGEAAPWWRPRRSPGSGGAGSCLLGGQGGGGEPHPQPAVEAEYRIRVNSVAPGTIMTPLLHRGRPEKISRCCPAALARPWRAREHRRGGGLSVPTTAFITGETIVADGGRIAQGVALFGTGAGNADATPRVNRGSTGEPSELRNTGR